MADVTADHAVTPLPDARSLQLAGDISVQDKDGLSHRFSDLYASPGQHLVIFVRHFFCGSCEEYTRALAAQLPASVLERATHPTSVVIIGCGASKLIPGYASRTNCPYPIYADPDRKLYKLLGMKEKITAGDEKPEYIQQGTGTLTVKSMINMIRSGTDIWQGGNFSQNGGEWLFETVEGGDVGALKWAHRMANTTDHTEVKGLKEVLGIEA